MHFLEIKTFDDAIAFVLERKQVDKQELHALAMKFGLDADAKLLALIDEHGIEVVGDDAY